MSLMFNRRIIASLKRRYGRSVSFHKLEDHSRDVENGEVINVFASRLVKRAIVLRARSHREFTYDLAFISANKDFTTGGFYDASVTRILVDPRDLGGVIFTADDLVTFDGETAKIVEAYKYPSGHVWSFLTRSIRGAGLMEVRPVHSGVILTHFAASTVVERLSRGVTSSLTLTHNLTEAV